MNCSEDYGNTVDQAPKCRGLVPSRLGPPSRLAISFAGVRTLNDGRVSGKLHGAMLAPLDTLQSIYSLAINYDQLHRYAEALQFHKEALEVRKVKLGVNHRDTLYSMWGVATNLNKLGRAEEAMQVIDECLRLAAGPAAEPSFAELADLRIRYYEKAKDAEGCRTTAELWENLRCTDPASCLHASRYRAIAAAVYRSLVTTEASRRADEQADLAMAWLHKVDATGFKDVDLRKDKDFSALWNREDFKNLLKKLSAAQPT